MPPKRIAVIGAGPVGLMSAKCLLEEGLQPVVYERTAHCGGLWRYHEEDEESLASVMKTTIINSSKEMIAFSDFPPPAHAPNFMHHRQVHEYILSYARAFDLEQYIHLCKEVIEVNFSEDYDATGRLTVCVRDTQTHSVDRNTFDGVMVCVGHHAYPNVPSIPGMDVFKGKWLHSHSLKKVDQFEDKRVVILGVGNSGVDAAVEISSVAEQVYLASRKGAWVLPRVGPWGLPFDIIATRRWLDYLFRITPYRLTCWFCELMLNHHRFDHETYNIKPKYRIWSQHPTISDNLPIKVLSGTVKIKKSISRFVEDGVVFEGDDKVTKCDFVVFATGYKILFPFLSDKMTAIKNNETNLYKYAFPPHLKHSTLAMVGLIQPIGAGFPVAEVQARWISLIFSGKLSIPPRTALEADIRDKNEKNAKRFSKSERHTIQVDFIPFLDEISSLFGAKPNLFKLFFTDNILFWTLLFGPSLPYQYRLQGPSPWKGARKAILEWETRIKLPTKMDFESKASTFVTALKYMLLTMLLAYVIHLFSIC